MFTVIALFPMAHIGNNVVRFIGKIVALAICILMDFAVGVNATLPLVAKEISRETLYQSGQRLVLLQWTKTKEL